MPTEVKAQNTTTLASVKAIYDAADQANTLLDGMQAAATAADTTLDGIYQDAADAQASADNASEYAARALGNLSTVQNITETLNWITAHGTMTLTSDVALDPTHVYFVVDAGGDYVVGGTHYSVVTKPDVDDISTYYELSINESLNNYVATHLAVDSEGLWIIPDAGGNKVLIATGSGSTYTTAGTYIVGKVNGVDTVLASFTASGAQIGQDGEFHVITDANAIGFYEGADNLSKMKSDGLHFYNGHSSSVADIVGGYDGTSKYGVITSGDAMIRLVDHDSNINNRYFEASVETDDSTYRYTGGSEVRGFDFVVSSDKYKLDGTTEDYIRLESGVKTTSGKALELSRRVNGGAKSVLFSVDKSGNVEAAGDVTDGSSNTLSSVATTLSSIAAHAVISTGSSNGWNYKKYADGTFEATRFSTSGATGAMTQIGSTGIYYSSAAEITFPSIGITGITSCLASVMPSSNYLMSYYMSRLTTAHVYFSYIRYGSGSAVTGISYGISITGTYS